jgi:SnoaL-like domain
MKSAEPISEDRALIRDLVENWAVWRDAGDWERFATVWHDDGFMMATWFQGPAKDFIRVSREGFERGVSILHFLGGTSIDVADKAPPSGAADQSHHAPPSGAADRPDDRRRAIAQTKMTISQRGEVHGVTCDVVCTGRFYDFLERRAGRWGIVLRQPIYEKDRLDPLDPAASLTLDPELLESLPVGYRHLAYVQTQIGFEVKRDMPGLVGPAVERLYRRGAEWLAGGELGDPLKTVD